MDFPTDRRIPPALACVAGWSGTGPQAKSVFSSPSLNKRDALVHLELTSRIFSDRFRSLHSPTMENPIDRTIRLMAIAAGLVSLLVYVVFQFV